MHIDYRTMEEDGAYYRLGTRRTVMAVVMVAVMVVVMVVVVVDAKLLLRNEKRKR